MTTNPDKDDDVSRRVAPITKSRNEFLSVFDQNNWGYIDKTGRFVINPQFDSASEFENGLAQVGLKAAKAGSVSDPARWELVDKY